MNMNVSYPTALPLEKPLRRKARRPQKHSKRMDNVHVQRNRHSYVRLLTAYANGPDRNVFILRILNLLDKRDGVAAARNHWAFLRKMAPLNTNTPFTQQQVVNIVNELNTTPRNLATLMNPSIDPRPVPEIDWEMDPFTALLAYARREPLTVYHELRVTLVVKRLPMTVITDALRPDITAQPDAAMWAIGFLKDLTTEERSQQALAIVGISATCLLLHLPQAL